MRAFVGIAIVDAIARVVIAYGQLRDAQERLAESVRRQVEENKNASDWLAKFNERAGTTFRTVKEANAAVEAGVLVWSEAANAYITAAKAAELAAAQQQALADAAERPFGEKVREQTGILIGQFNEMRTAGKTAAEAIEEIFKGKNLGAKEDVAALGGAITQLALFSRESEAEIRAGLAEALKQLTTEQLVQFGATAREVFDQSTNGARRLGVVLTGVLDGALKELGLSLEEVRTGMSDTERAASSAFAGVRDSIKDAGLDAKQQADGIERAFREAMSRAKSAVAKSKLGAELKKAFDAGQISFQQYQQLLNELNGRMSDSQEQADETADAIRRLNQEMAGAGDTTENTGEQVEDATEKMSGAGAAAATLAGAMEGWSNHMASLSVNAQRAWQAMTFGAKGTAEDVDAVTARLGELEYTLDFLAHKKWETFDPSGLQQMFQDMRRSAAEVEIQFLEQKQALDKLVGGYESGEVGLSDFIRRASSARDSLNLLDEADLSALDSSIESAKNQLESLRDSSFSTLESLQNELDRMRGNTAAVEERRYKAQVRELQDQLNEAQESGDQRSIANLRQALNIAREVYAVKRAEISAETTAARQRSADSVGNSDTPRPNVLPSPNTDKKTTVLRLEMPNGIVTEGEFQDEQAEKFIKALQTAGMRINR
jgi:hypothetical protein